MDKLGRNYQLQVQTQTGATLTVALPFTIEFDITRNTLTSANVCQIRLYNLSLINRNQLRFNISDFGTYRAVLLKAGYGDNLATIFQGNISQAWSVREGVNFITQIECYDGGFAFNNGKVDLQFPSGVTQGAVFSSVVGTLPKVKTGAVSPDVKTLPRGNTYSGSSIDTLNQLRPKSWFIDKETLNSLNDDEYIAEIGPETIINNKSGLLGTPVLEQTIVRFDMIFEPALNPGERVFLDSLTENNFNGHYKITGVKHRGMISEAVCGSLVTTGEFFYTKILKPVAKQ